MSVRVGGPHYKPYKSATKQVRRMTVRTFRTILSGFIITAGLLLWAVYKIFIG